MCSLRVDYHQPLPKGSLPENCIDRLLSEKSITNEQAGQIVYRLFPISNKPQKLSFRGSCAISSPNGMRVLLHHMIRHKGSFTALSFTGFSFTPDAWHAFVNSLKYCKELAELEFDSCTLTLSQLQELGSALSYIKDDIIHLSICNNPVEGNNWQFLDNFLNGNTRLCRLTVSHNRLGDLGLKNLLAVISRIDNLYELILDGNFIMDKGVNFLEEWLRNEKNRIPTFLSLNANQITNEGLKLIVSFLRDYSAVTISFVNNNIDANGIATALDWLGGLDQIAFDKPITSRPVIELYAGLQQSLELLRDLT